MSFTKFSFLERVHEHVHAGSSFENVFMNEAKFTYIHERAYDVNNHDVNTFMNEKFHECERERLFVHEHIVYILHT